MLPLGRTKRLGYVILIRHLSIDIPSARGKMFWYFGVDKKSKSIIEICHFIDIGMLYPRVGQTERDFDDNPNIQTKYIRNGVMIYRIF